jgi:protein phosphatase 1L
MVKSGIVYTANLGDSRAVVIGSDGNLQYLNRTHILKDPEENERVCQSGGIIIHRGGTYRLNGELALSRSLGDLRHKPCLSSTPETSAYRNGRGNFLIMASDGFWDEAD